MTSPTSIFSITKSSQFTILLSKEVFIRMFSTKASWGPFTTTSLDGFSTPRCLKPFTSMSKATEIVSINKAQFPRINT